MKTLSLGCLALGALGMLFSHAAFYWLGYSESSSAFAAVDPFRVMSCEALWFVGLFVLTLFTISKRWRSWWPLGSLLAFWPALVLIWCVLGPPDRLLAYGLRDRMMHDYTLADLRRFAREVQQDLPHDQIMHGDNSYLPPSEKAAYARLGAEFPFLRYDWKPNLDDSNVNTVEMAWGGTLMGHWGCSISTDGSTNTGAHDNRKLVLPVSDDIYFFYGD